MSASPQVVISPLLAVSVTNQCDMIKKLLSERGIPSTYKSMVSVWDIKDDKYRAFLWFQLATLRFIGDGVVPYLLCEKPKAFYVTVEGIPSKAHILHSNIPKIDFIANSQFTRSCLEQGGLTVSDVIHHAVDWEKCQALQKDSEQLKNKWEKDYPERVKFLYVGRNDPRKGLNLLAKAIEMVNDTIQDQVAFMLFTEGSLPEMEKFSNVIRVGQVNTLPYDQVLRLIGACDFFVFPSIAEGFGVPVLEANAMGRPAIHCWMPPLSEFSSKEFNFVFGYSEEQLVNQQNLQYWLFHNYRPELLADMILGAANMFKTSRAEYDEYCAKAVEHSKKWDYHNIYPKLLDRLKC